MYAVSTRGQLLRARGELALWRGDTSDARAALLGAISACGDSLKETDTRGLEGRSLEILGAVEHYDGKTTEASTSFILAAVIFRKLGLSAQVTRAVASLAAAVDDGTAELLLQATLPPLQRLAMLRALGDSLLCSARIAQRLEQARTARHRAHSALGHFEETKDRRGTERANNQLFAGTRVTEVGRCHVHSCPILA